MTMAPNRRRLRIELNEQVATEIRAWMGRKRLSQVRLAAALGENDMWLYRRLQSRQMLDTSDLLRIAEVFEIDVLDLFPKRFGSNERSGKPFGGRRPRRISRRRRPAPTNVPSSQRRPVPVRPAVSMLNAA